MEIKYINKLELVIKLDWFNMDECCQLTDKDSYEDCKYKYDILIRLRDHEHTVLWQKFNVFLGSNTIIVAIIAGVLSFQEFRGNPQTAQNIIESTFSPIAIFTFWCIFSIAFISSIFMSRILKGSDYWIDFWERKLYFSESKITLPSASNVGIFVDHPSRSKNELKGILKNCPEKIDDALKKQIIHYCHSLENALEKNYLSTRKNMGRFIQVITGIWGFFFIVSGTFVIFEILNYFHVQNIDQISLLVGIGVILLILTAGFYWAFIYFDNKEIKELISDSKTILQK